MPLRWRALSLFIASLSHQYGCGVARTNRVNEANERDSDRETLERKMSAAAKLASVGYWEYDFVVNQITWSEDISHALGLPLTDRTRRWAEFRQLVHPDDRQAVDQRRREMRSGQHSFHATFRLLVPESGLRYVETVCEAVRDANGHTVRVVGAIQDASERMRAQEALRGSQERFQLALHATGLAPWEWDVNTNEVNFWPEWKRQLGYEPDQISNRYEEWESRLHPEDRDRVLTALRSYLDVHQPDYNLEFRLRHKSGTYRWIYSRGVVLRDATGRQTHMIGGHLDITQRKQLEEQYRQSQKMQAIGQLAGGIAHDFNNLLIVISGYADLVANEIGPSHPSRGDLDEIRAGAASAARLTRQLLAFSRRQILQPQVLDANEVLRRLEHLLARVIGENIRLIMNLSAVGRVIGDPGQIEQVIMNLAINARDAMPTGGRLMIETADVDLDSAFVAAHPGARAGRHVMIAASDTGAGMDEATRARLFEPFFTTKPPGRGTGLGLATVYGIVKQSGGSIWVDSEPATGSTFKIYLPVATGAVVDDSATPEINVNELRGIETVLVVEDQLEVRELIERTLRRFGYTVIGAPTGAIAIAAARAHEGAIHLLLTDVVLPGASGREIAWRLVAERKSMRVLYMSGYTDDAIVQHGLLETGLAFIQKPFTGEVLVRRIREVLAAEHPPTF